MQKEFSARKNVELRRRCRHRPLTTTDRRISVLSVHIIYDDEERPSRERFYVVVIFFSPNNIRG